MIIKRFRNGELQFYLGSLPKELSKYRETHPENKKYVQRFLDQYRYDYTKKIWRKN